MKEHDRPTRRDGVGDDHLMSIEEVGAYLQVPVKTLYDWRHRGCGPRGMRVGRYVRYRRQDVDVWLDSCRDPEPTVAFGSRKAS